MCIDIYFCAIKHYNSQRIPLYVHEACQCNIGGLIVLGISTDKLFTARDKISISHVHVFTTHPNVCRRNADGQLSYERELFYIW